MAVRDKLWSIICNLSPWKETDVDKVAKLEERMTQLDVSRMGITEAIVGLEEVEAKYLQEGTDAMSAGRKLVAKRFASQLASVRRALKRQHVEANMHSQAIKVIDTNIHNLRLVRVAEELQLPTDENLAETFAVAEEQVENLDVLAKMADGMDAGTEAEMSDDELDILKEFGEVSAVETTAQDKVAVTEAIPSPSVAWEEPEKVKTEPEADPVC